MRFSWLKSWGAAGAVAATVIAGAGCSSIPFLAEPTPAAPARAAVPAAAPEPEEVVVNGSLVFPRRVELSFDISGEVDEVLVEQGDVVLAGQVLARLDPLMVVAMEQQLAEAVLKLDRTQESLDLARQNYDLFPLEDAERRRNIAQATQDIAGAEEVISDYLWENAQSVVRAKSALVNAEVAVDNAQDRLSDYQRDFERQNGLAITAARALVASRELEIEQIQRRLGNLDVQYDERVANARVSLQVADEAVETAEDNLTAFLRRPIPDYDNRKPIDLEILERIRTRLLEAQTNFKAAENVLADLERHRGLETQQLESAVALAQAALAQAKEDLSQLENFADQDLELLRLRTAVDTAKVAVTEAERVLSEASDGPDQERLAVMERTVELARERLEKLYEEPEWLDVAMLETTLITTQTFIDDLNEDMAAVELRAPISGVVALVNVEEDDQVSRDSRVLEIVDPSEVTVNGVIDANDIGLVRLESPARVSIASVPGQEFAGTVTHLAGEPSTERGVVSYPVHITIDLPEGVEVPVRLSAVSTVIPVNQ